MGRGTTKVANHCCGQQVAVTFVETIAVCSTLWGRN